MFAAPCIPNHFSRPDIVWASSAATNGGGMSKGRQGEGSDKSVGASASKGDVTPAIPGQPKQIARRSAPRRNLKYGKRIFDLNLSDRIEGVWDENIPMVQQTVIEGTGIAAETLRSIEEIMERCDEICRTFQFSVLESVFYDFTPGLSVVFVLSESHMAIHTWPDKGYLNLDIITCTKRGVDPVRLADLFAEIFEPSSLRCHRITF